MKRKAAPEIPEGFCPLVPGDAVRDDCLVWRLGTWQVVGDRAGMLRKRRLGVYVKPVGRMSHANRTVAYLRSMGDLRIVTVSDPVCVDAIIMIFVTVTPETDTSESALQPLLDDVHAHTYIPLTMSIIFLHPAAEFLAANYKFYNADTFAACMKRLETYEKLAPDIKAAVDTLLAVEDPAPF